MYDAWHIKSCEHVLSRIDVTCHDHCLMHADLFWLMNSEKLIPLRVMLTHTADLTDSCVTHS